MLPLLLSLFVSSAHAQCPGDVREVLSCSSVVSGQLDGGPWSGAVPPSVGDPGWVDMQSYDNDLGDTCDWQPRGPFLDWECDGTEVYECGGPTDWGQEGPEHVYEFTCQQDGFVDVQVTNLDCDLDIYILDDSCDPVNGCEAESVQYNVIDDAISFYCTAGNTYYVTVEGFGFTFSGWYSYVYVPSLLGQPPDPGYCGPEFGMIRGNYTLEFLPGDPATSGCVELCDNGLDDDGNGDIDCDDVACVDDPICNVAEDCTNGIDDDGDGDADCLDDDCLDDPTCCDDDNDGFIDPACGGGDCDDSVFHAPESDSDGVPDACDPCPTESFETDGDLDGSWSCDDCDDTRDDVVPGGTEVCDGLDNDCNGIPDDGLTLVDYWLDDDDDGYGDEGSTPVASCDGAPVGYVADDTDCDDTLDTVNPAATELCDGIDNDCNGTPDDGVVFTDYYLDADGDGYGDPGSAPMSACDGAPVGYVVDATDCDDTLDTIHPGATEVCDGIDNDCSGTADDGVVFTDYYVDDDGDGYGDGSTTPVSACDGAPSGYVVDGTDCDDTDADLTPEDADGDYVSSCDGDCADDDPSRSPGATEVADGVDQDCDGIVDETTEAYDDDGDGVTELGGDCNDADPTISPTAVEVCDTVNQDCDLETDEDTECSDDDGDGFSELDGDCHDGDPAIGPDAPEIDDNLIDDDCDGVVDDGVRDDDNDGFADSEDCDDTDPDVHPGATEEANGVDDDCDGSTDEDTTASDDDGDGVSEEDGDCDDADASVSPSATETANGRDDDCDGIVDEGTDVYDDDGDGVSEAAGDCDDTDADVSPSASEVANGVDDDCDGDVDEDLDDVDGDGVTAAEGDCDDTNGWIRPGLAETCGDGLDNDCSGVADDGCLDAEAGPPAPEGCGCDTTTAPTGALPLALGGMLLWMRRRRTALAAVAGTAALVGCKSENGLRETPSRLEVSPTILDAGDVAVGDEAEVFVQIDHLQGFDIEIRRATLTHWEGEAFEVELDGGVFLEAGGSLEIPVTYRPDELGWHRSQLTLTHDGLDSPSKVELRGHGVEARVLVGPPVLDFGPVEDGGQADGELFVANQGVLPITVDDIELPAGVLLDGDPLPLEVGGGAQVVWALRYTADGAPLAGWARVLDSIGDVLGTVDLRANDCARGVPALYDQDGDGVTSCGGDCDDSDPTIAPGAAEVPDGVDQDCDEDIDEGTSATDDDGDGFCEDSCTDGSLPGDCHDGDDAIAPDVTEVANNGIDDDCDGEVDANVVDADNDGWGASVDCDDSDPSVNPGAAEVANGVDDNCVDGVDEGTVNGDDDGDGQSEADGDCDDSDPGIAAGQPEVADGRDQDCDGLVDEGTVAYDDDGDGYTENGGDCDDGDPDMYPNAGC